MQNVGLDCAGVVGLHVHPSQKHTRNGAQNNDLFDHFQDVYRGGPKLLPRDVHGVPRGFPVRPKVAAKGCPWGAKGRRGVPKRCQGMSMGSQAGPPGHQKDAKESNSVTNAEARGENPRRMSPRCLPDVSQMSPRCLPRCLSDVFQDVSQMSPRFLFPDFSCMMILHID